MAQKVKPGLVNCKRDGQPEAEATALYVAVESKSIHAVQIASSSALLRPLSILDTRCGAEQLTPLELAVQSRLLDIAKALLSAGARCRFPEEKGGGMRRMSLLHACAVMLDSTPPTHQLGVFDLLIPHFADGVDITSSGSVGTAGNNGGNLEPPFFLAVRFQQYSLALALLDHGAAIDFEVSSFVDDCDRASSDTVSLGLDNTDMTPRPQITVLGALLEFRTPANMASIRFLFGYDGFGKKKKDHRYQIPSPVVVRAM